MNERVVVAMSGGVDSSVAAALLKEQGYAVLGVTMQLWGKEVCVSSGSRRCCSVRDALDARTVARQLGIPHETLDLAQRFRSDLIDYFVESYRAGLTPNPCIACNDTIKFGALLEYADRLGASRIATGHYARTAHDKARDRVRLRRAVDGRKDQAYVLFDLTQAQLARALFPLGALSKTDVRQLAKTLGLGTAEKPDSQDICFIQDRDKTGFLRTALGIASTAPLYVIALDPANNRLVVGRRAELLRRTLLAERVNWVSIAPPRQPIRSDVQIRSRHTPAPAWISRQPDGSVWVEFDDPQPAIAPGQAAVFFDGEEVLGGGWISPHAPDGDDALTFAHREASCR